MSQILRISPFGEFRIPALLKNYITEYWNLGVVEYLAYVCQSTTVFPSFPLYKADAIQPTNTLECFSPGLMKRWCLRSAIYIRERPSLCSIISFMNNAKWSNALTYVKVTIHINICHKCACLSVRLFATFVLLLLRHQKSRTQL